MILSQARAAAVSVRRRWKESRLSLAVVTGASRGIGLELVRQLRARGGTVLAVCRQGPRELADLGARVVDGCDVAEPASWERVAAAVGDDRVDLLVHNAGILVGDSLDAVDLDAVRRQLEINAVAPLFLTRALLPRLRAGAKIALITSRMGSMGDNGSGAYYGYREH